MCNYIYRKYSCQHYYYLVDSWCPKYIETWKKCDPVVVRNQYWRDEICGACRQRQQPSNHPCANMVKRPNAAVSHPYHHRVSA
ncbi:hypothetical protein B0I35DRAFT_365679 [Stachybotrys elegans]|uniref:Uncharacterized protein n=1 Tax=Stachybotrys elegans TaxID=80388 RepID=A0A8K0WK69_9HYPO|nr:hypothetical protein B0I35DRAFT_365679 [Stachybotrys elegans]